MKLAELLAALNTLRVLHWQTLSYAEHKALGNAYDQLDDLFDRYVETYYGKMGRPDDVTQYQLTVEGMSDVPTVQKIQAIRDQIVPGLRQATHKDLNNIVDEIEEVFNRTIYLLNLK